MLLTNEDFRTGKLKWALPAVGYLKFFFSFYSYVEWREFSILCMYGSLVYKEVQLNSM